MCCKLCKKEIGWVKKQIFIWKKIISVNVNYTTCYFFSLPEFKFNDKHGRCGYILKHTVIQRFGVNNASL